MKCGRCGRSILTKQQFIEELEEKHSIRVDPYNADKFSVSGVSIGMNAYDNFMDRARATYDMVQKLRAFKCQGCGMTYCMKCLLKHAPAHPNGGKACFSCKGVLAEV
jgi:hypothetical protein